MTIDRTLIIATVQRTTMVGISADVTFDTARHTAAHQRNRSACKRADVRFASFQYNERQRLRYFG
jgi:hypothetical protein